MILFVTGKLKQFRLALDTKNGVAVKYFHSEMACHLTGYAMRKQGVNVRVECDLGTHISRLVG